MTAQNPDGMKLEREPGSIPTLMCPHGAMYRREYIFHETIRFRVNNGTTRTLSFIFNLTSEMWVVRLNFNWHDQHLGEKRGS